MTPIKTSLLKALLRLRAAGPACAALVLALALAVPTTVPVQAQQSRPGKPNGAPTAPVRPVTLDELFERLARSKSEDEAKGIAGAIERRWMRSGSDTADLLMSRALDALKAGDQPLSIELLDRVVTLQPAWAEGWNKRATVFFLMGDNTRAMADIREVLSLEPRHFGALAGMGMIMRSAGDDKKAYAAFKQALSIHPFLGEVRSAVERMAPDVEGRDI